MMLFPLLVFMVEFYGVAGDDPKLLGTYTGVLASMFPLSMFITSFFWGWLSDRIGRKPVTLIGGLSIGIGSVLLGFTTDYYMALTIRIVTGLFNNITSMLKCMISEMSGKHLAKGMAYFSVAWTTGTLIGPSLAGILAMPCQQYGHRFPTCEHEDAFLNRFPFFLSFFFFGVFTLCSAIYAALVVPETLKNKKPLGLNKGLRRVLTFRSSAGALRGADGSSPKRTYEDVKYEHLEDPKGKEGLELTEVMSGNGNGNGMDNGHRYEEGREVSDEDEDQGLLSSSAKSAGANEESWFRNRDVQLACFLYGMVALFYVAFEELFPLFGSARVENGGLSLASKDVGIFMSIGGGFTIPYSLLLFPRLVKAKGTLWLVKFGSITCMVLAVFTPFMRLLATQVDHPDEDNQINRSGLGDMSPLLWVVMTVHAILIHVTGTNCFASIIIVVNMASPKAHFGAVNSYGQALASLMRVIGPGSVGLLWTLCGRIKGSTMLQVSLPFVFCGLTALAMFVLALVAPKHLDSRT